MSWFSNLFTRKVVLVAPEVEEVQAQVEEAEAMLGSLVMEHRYYTDANTAEAAKLRDLREEVACLQSELARIKREPTYQSLLDIIGAQETANRAMKEVVQKYAKQL